MALMLWLSAPTQPSIGSAFASIIASMTRGSTFVQISPLKFFDGIGFSVINGYGITECAPLIAVNPYFAPKKGSVGPSVPCCTVRIDADHKNDLGFDEGEIQVKGDNVMLGYYNNPEATAEVLKNGWLYTGDMGAIKGDLLYVYGRFKSLLIAADGEKYSPEGMEEAIVDKSPLIDQIIIYNNQSPYTSAIVVPNREAMRQILGGKSDEESLRAAAKAIGAEVDKYRTGGEYADEFPDRWLPGALAIVGEAFLDVMGGNFGAELGVGFWPLCVGFLTAFLSGCAACKFMLNIVNRGKLIWFAVYCAVAGVVAIVSNFM